MRIALVHDHYSEEHLAQVMEEMKTLGAPKIHAVWHPAYGHWAALEGCHRIRAAKELGLTPEIIDVEYSEEMVSTVVGHADEDYPISEICDDSHRSTIIGF
jgi:hypothetical protein